MNDMNPNVNKQLGIWQKFFVNKEEIFNDCSTHVGSCILCRCFNLKSPELEQDLEPANQKIFRFSKIKSLIFNAKWQGWILLLRMWFLQIQDHNEYHQPRGKAWWGPSSSYQDFRQSLQRPTLYPPILLCL